MNRLPRPLVLTLLASSALAPATALAQSAPLPTGGAVAAGSAQIGAPSGGAMAITQTSDKAIINWQGFSIGQGNRVDISQPSAQSALLNRVTGTATSEIAGQLNANGQVYLINPNGIMITNTGSVNAAGFVASTLDLSDEAFMRGDIIVTGRGGSVSNAGTISIAKGGYAALIGGKVDNSGLILAPLGKVALGAGTQATLDFESDGFLQVAMPIDADGGIAMSGRITASGGAVILSAARARGAARGVVSLASLNEATQVSMAKGVVQLGDGGGVASAALAAPVGGSIALSGATIDVSGTGGGGTVRIGGDYQGGGPLAHASTLTVDAATTINADAIGTGNGGKIVLWSDDRTDFAGGITARGAGGGDGGDAEVSGKALLGFTGTADLTGANWGTLLLDPYDVVIGGTTNSNFDANFTAIGDPSRITTATLLAALRTANVTVSTGSGGTQAGDIALNSDISWTSGATLTLNAANNILLNGSVSAAAGGLTLNAGGAIRSQIFANGGTPSAVSVARFTLAGGAWTQLDIGRGIDSFSAGDFRITGGSFLRASGGAGTAANPYTLIDIYGVQGMGTLLGGSFTLANDIDASGTALWNGGAGFSPIGSSSAGYTGTFDGAGHVVGGLSINRPRQDGVGLFGLIDATGSVANVGLVGGTIIGRDAVGALAGRNRGRTDRSSSNAAVSGASFVGGLVGILENADTTVFSRIDRSYSSGTVNGLNNLAGGLVGSVSSGNTVATSYATGSVTGGSFVGGLVGRNDGSVTQSWSSGLVSGSGQYVGGFSGTNVGSVTNSYFDTNTSGRSNGDGFRTSATGLTTAQARTSAAYTGFDFTNTWYQSADLRPILRSEAADAVNGVIAVSNLHQLQLMAANLAGSYVLTRTLDASATASTAASADVFGAGGFVPVGFGSNRFTGALNGAGNVIMGLVIDRSGGGAVGLFGTSSGTIRDIGLVGGSVTGSTAYDGSLTFTGTGALVGTNLGTITRSFATTTVTGGAAAVDFVGGLVGVNGGLNGQAGTITQSYATGNVSGGRDVGGLVGDNYGTITQSYATGSAASNAGDGVAGGLAGGNNGVIRQSYAIGAASGGGFANGGLVGVNRNLIDQSYASGSSTGGGLVGFASATGNTNSTVTASYWDIQSSGQATSAGGTGLTTAQARTSAAYTGFDFTNIWYQAGDLRPILRSEAAAAVNGVIAVTNLHQLQLMGTNLSGSYRLSSDVDASLTASTAASSGIWGAGGFQSVGSGTAFNGSFNGAGYTVSGLTINSAGDYVGLFGSMGAGGTITNVRLAGGSITGRTYVGALVGDSNGTVSLVSSSVNVTGGGAVGGLIGSISAGRVSQAMASGTVRGSGTSIGGFAGQNYGTLSQVYATGNVASSASGFATSSAGGLLGLNVGSVDQAYSTGRVQGLDNGVSAYGGLIASNRGTVTSAYYNTDTSGRTSSAGGIGLTTAQMQDVTAFRTNFAGFDFDTAWSPPSTGAYSSDGQAHYPELYALTNVVGVLSGGGSRVYGDAASTLALATYTGVHAGDFVTTLGISAGDPTTATSNVGSYTGTTGSGTVVTSAIPGRVYRSVYVPGTFVVTPATLTVSGATGINKTYDATTALNAGTVAATFTGARNGDVLTLTPTSAAYDSANAGARTIAVSGLSVGGAKAGNYVLNTTSVTGSGTISPATLTYVASAASRQYGLANPAFAGTVTGFVGGETQGSATTGTLAFTSPATTASNVGSYAILGSGLAANNYVFVQAAGNPTALSITPYALTITGEREYDMTTTFATPTLAISAGVNGETVALTGGSGTTASADVGSYVGSPLSNLSISVAGGNALASNYLLPTTGTLIIDRRAITATTVFADPQSRLYGNANPVLTYQATNLMAGMTLNGTLATDATVTSNVGQYAITQGTLTNANNPNYDIRYIGNFLTVTARPITVAANALSLMYGVATPALGYTVGGSGLANNDTLSGALATDRTATSNVGSYAITQGSLGTANTNYAIRFTGNTLTVTPRTISVAADALSRIYGDANPALTYQVGGNGLVGRDTLSGALATSATPTSSVGGYAITQGSLGNPNYAITSFTSATLAVTPRALVVTPDATSRIYGNANPASGTAVGNNLVNGDTVTAVALSSTATTASNVGAYDLFASAATGTGLSNYAIGYATRTGGLAVTPRPVTVSADALSRIYGDTNPALTFAVGGSGLVNGDTSATAFGGALATSATPASAIGSYAIAQGSLAPNANYMLTGFTGATLAVTPRALVITPDALSRLYGDANPARGTAAGDTLVNGDTVSSVALLTPATATSGAGRYDLTGSNAQGTGLGNYTISYATRIGGLSVAQRPVTVTADALSRIYGDANPALTYTTSSLGAGTALSGSLATSATTTSPVGSYGIAQGTVTNANNANYEISYVGANLAVMPRALLVTPDATSRLYGDANPATGTATADNLVNGDTVASVMLSTPATVSSGVGNYALTASAATGTGLGNYAISYGTRIAGLGIVARPITVSANALSRVYGDANPALTYAVGNRGLVNGDTLTGGLTTSTTTASGIGGYGIGLGTLAASANYAVTYVGASLTITPRPLSIVADSQTRFFGEANAPLTFVTGARGLVNGDRISGALSTTATVTSAPGAYAVSQGTLSVSPNYAITYTPGIVTIGIARFVPLGFRAGTQDRDAFALDTTPAGDAGVLRIGSNAEGSPTLESRNGGPLLVCPRERPCPSAHGVKVAP